MAIRSTNAKSKISNPASKKRSPSHNNKGKGRVLLLEWSGTLIPQETKGDVTRIKFCVLIDGPGTIVLEEMRADNTRNSFDPLSEPLVPEEMKGDFSRPSGPKIRRS